MATTWHLWTPRSILVRADGHPQEAIGLSRSFGGSAGAGVSDFLISPGLPSPRWRGNLVFIRASTRDTLPARLLALAGRQADRNKEVARMTISPDPSQIRTIVFRTFLELDVDEERLQDLDERIMLDDGRYVARSYRVDDFLAMWMIDVGLVQFYDGEGNMLRTVNLFEEIEPQRMAA
jgi:hypothetical protein